MVRRKQEQEQDRDLGFGSVVRQGGTRLFNRDGSFAVTRSGSGWRAALSAYHSLLTTSWSRFLLLAAAVYLLFNLLFGLAYFACGRQAIMGPNTGGPFLRAFFLAVQTSSTVGYGQLAPASLVANGVMVLQAFLSLTMVALGAGVIFARFSRPIADIAWSDRGVIAPYRGITGFMIRIAHRRKHQIFDLHAKMILTLTVMEDGVRKRIFQELELERNVVSFLPLSWTIVHPIDEASPLHGIAREQFLEGRGEVIVLLQGRDATSAQDVHDWTSYAGEEVVFNARFLKILGQDSPGGLMHMDIGRINEYEDLS